MKRRNVSPLINLPRFMDSPFRWCERIWFISFYHSKQWNRRTIAAVRNYARISSTNMRPRKLTTPPSSDDPSIPPSPPHPPRIFVRARISLRFNRMDQTNKRQSSLQCILLKFPCRISLCAEIPAYFPLSIDAKNDAFPSLKVSSYPIIARKKTESKSTIS